MIAIINNKQYPILDYRTEAGKRLHLEIIDEDYSFGTLEEDLLASEKISIQDPEDMMENPIKEEFYGYNSIFQATKIYERENPRFYVIVEATSVIDEMETLLNRINTLTATVTELQARLNEKFPPEEN